MNSISKPADRGGSSTCLSVAGHPRQQSPGSRWGSLLDWMLGKGLASVGAIFMTLLASREAPAQSAQYPMPPAGSVYKEFFVVMPVNNQNLWRVTDPNSPFPSPTGCTNCPEAFLPNDCLAIPNVDLVGAVSAQLEVDLWSGHVGTTGRALRFNTNPCGGMNNAWIPIPDVATAPSPQRCYIAQNNLIMNIPLTQLVGGTNYLQGTCGNQTGCPGTFNWGQFGWYMALLRVYYDPATKPHTTGQISSHANGGALQGNPTSVPVAATTNGAATHVEFFAFHDAYDADGDGVYLDWQRHRHINLPSENTVFTKGHVGTVTGSGPYNMNWNTAFIPDQAPGSIRLRCHVRHSSGTWYAGPDVTGLSLVRPGVSYKLYKPTNVPANYWVRANQIKSSNFTIPAGDNLATATGAWLMVRTWNGLDGQNPNGTRWTKLNRNTANEWTAPPYGRDHFYSFDMVSIFQNSPVTGLQTGTNSVSFFSSSSHHGIEILWPGPAVLVCYPAAGGGPPPTPTGLAAMAQVGQVQLSWNGSGAAYNVYRSSSSGFTPGAGNRIASSVVGTTYLDPGLGEGLTFHYKVTALGADLQESSASNQASATTPVDTLPPTIASVAALGMTSVRVIFSEPVALTSAQDAMNYQILNGAFVGVSGAVREADQRSVLLTTGALTSNEIYTLIVNGVTDQSLAANVALDAAHFVYDPGLISHFPLNEDRGSTAFDQGPGGHHGSVLGAQFQANGVNGTPYLHFDGVDDRVDLGVINPSSNALTLACWFKPDSFGVTDGRLISRASAVDDSANLWMLSTIQSGSNFRLRGRVRTGNATATVIASSGNLALDTWMHAALVYDGAQMRLYLDGVLVGSLAKTGTLNTSTTVGVAIGNQPTGAGLRPFHGCIDEVRIYSRALSLAEIQALATLPPVAVSDQHTVIENEQLIVPAPGVLANDQDPQGDPLMAQLSSDVSHGVLSLQANGSFTYTPDVGYVGLDGFTYRATDGGTSSAPALVSIQVEDAGPGSPPEIESTAPLGGQVGVLYSYDVNASDPDPSDADVLTYSLTMAPGGADIDPVSGVVTWLPAAPGNFCFTVQVCDDEPLCDTQSWCVEVVCTGCVQEPSLPSVNLPLGVVGAAYSACLQVSCGTGSLAWSAPVPGDLPPGVSIHPSTGCFVGTPTTVGIYEFDIQVCDTCPLCDVATYLMEVVETPPCDGSLTSLPGRLELFDYRTGGQGVAYFDSTAGNQFGACRTDDVDIGGVECVIGAITTGEWLEYCVYIAAAATYDVTISHASGGTGGRLRIELDGTAVTAGISTGNTGGWGTYETQTVGGVVLPSGFHVLRVFIEKAGFNLDWIDFQTDGPPAMPPVITTTSLPAATVGAAYAQGLTATGGTGSYDWAIVDPAQTPPGLGLDPNTGALSGTPSTSGQFCFTVEVCDAGDLCDTQLLCLTVQCGGCSEPPVVTRMALPNAQVGLAYEACLAATCGTGAFEWDAVDPAALPPGLSVNAMTGCVVGTPTVGGDYAFEIVVCDSCMLCDFEMFTINVAGVSPCAGPQNMIPGTLEVSRYRDGGQGVAYFDTTAGNQFGGCRTGDVDLGGSDPNDCVIGAIVTGEWVEYCVSIQAASSYQLIVRHASGAGGGRLHVAVGGNNLTGTIQTSGTGGWGTYQELVYGDLVLPAGQHVLRIFFQAGGFNLDHLQFVADGPPPSSAPTITTSTLPGATAGQQSSIGLQASGGMAPYAWSVVDPGDLPAGMSVDPATGELAGTPAVPGTFCFEVEVCGSDDLCSSKTLCLAVACGACTQDPRLSGGTLPLALVGESYQSCPQATCATGLLSFAVSDEMDLPPGMSLDGDSGCLEGTPTLAGIYDFEIEVCDACPACGSALYSLEVVDVPACDGVLTTLPGRLELSNYRNGGQGVAYFDTTAGNQFGACRTDDVDIGGGECVIGSIATNEWLTYCVNIQQAGLYDLSIRHASGASAGGRLRIDLDGTAVTGTISPPTTGNWGTYQDHLVTGIQLPAGNHVLRVWIVKNGFNLDSIEFSPSMR